MGSKLYADYPMASTARKQEDNKKKRKERTKKQTK